MMRFGLRSLILVVLASPVRAGEAEEVDSVSRHGITWRFDRKTRVQHFVNGDPYVIGPVTVVAIEPKPAEGRNGSVLNLPPINGRSGFDSRSPGGRFDAKLRAEPPIAMKPGDALVSTASVEKVGELRAQLRTSDRTSSPVRSASILTCLAEPAPPDAFRPSYCDRKGRIYRAKDLRRDLLPNLAKVEGPPAEEGWVSAPDIREWALRFERPWLDTVTFGFDAPVEYMPHYGREIGRAAGIASLILMLDYPAEEKEPLLIGFVQYGIDLWGIARAGHPGWPAHGGHGSGRKWPIVFAGILLGDEAMQHPARLCPTVRFGEDMQTIHGEGWNGASALYAGHIGADGEKYQKGWGAYEHLHPSKWPGMLGESYRRCCTSIAWVGQALAARILHAEKVWDHDAFFDYVDRWMEEDDGDDLKAIREATGQDFSASWSRQGQAWDPFVNAMWAKYRHTMGKGGTR